MVTSDKVEKLQRRKRRVRRRIFGDTGRPRLSVFRSKKHIYAQIVDDTTGKTLAAASTLDKALKATLASSKPLDAAKAVGQALAERAKAVQIEAVVFDRGGRLFHGRIKALAEGSRERGLKF
ncbi:50S ribosomal protein L18 [Candidatus Nitrospira bockiana]